MIYRFPLFKKILLGCWILVLALAGLKVTQSDIALAEIPQQLQLWLENFGVLNAAILYILLYTFRPLILFPATLMTLTSGLVFGPWLGVLLTFIGENLSANFAFALARWLGRDWVSDHEGTRLRHWDARIRQNGLAAVLTMRLIYLPFDLVNYGCGLTGVKQRDFALGTAIGILPALVSFVLLGGSLAADSNQLMVMIPGAIALLIASLLLARHLKRRTTSSALETS